MYDRYILVSMLGEYTGCWKDPLFYYSNCFSNHTIQDFAWLFQLLESSTAVHITIELINDLLKCAILLVTTCSSEKGIDVCKSRQKRTKIDACSAFSHHFLFLASIFFCLCLNGSQILNMGPFLVMMMKILPLDFMEALFIWKFSLVVSSRFAVFNQPYHVMSTFSFFSFNVANLESGLVFIKIATIIKSEFFYDIK